MRVRTFCSAASISHFLVNTCCPFLRGLQETMTSSLGSGLRECSRSDVRRILSLSVRPPSGHGIISASEYARNLVLFREIFQSWSETSRSLCVLVGHTGKLRPHESMTLNAGIRSQDCFSTLRLLSHFILCDIRMVVRHRPHRHQLERATTTHQAD